MSGSRLALVVAVALIAPAHAGPAEGSSAAGAAVDPCGAVIVEEPVLALTATAGIVANFSNAANSLRTGSDEVLTRGREAAAAATPPEGLCPRACETQGPSIVVRSTPTSFLDDYAEAEHCERLLAETTARPIVFRRRFDSMDALDAWIGRITRGKGDEGRELYRRCDGRCSPRYDWTIVPRGDGADVSAEVVCGPARDRVENRYALSSSLLWSCRATGESAADRSLGDSPRPGRSSPSR